MDLWAVAIPGPDEIWAMPSRQIAEESAYLHNEKLIREFIAERWGVRFIDLQATAILWPGDEASHAIHLTLNEPLYPEEI